MSASTTATFHGREPMHRAVRSIVDRGIVPAQGIRVSRRAITPDGRVVEARGRSRGLVPGALAGAAVATVAVLLWWTLAAGEWSVGGSWLVYRLVTVALSGALGGALVGTVLASASDRHRRLTATDDYVVHVDARDDAAATRIREELSRMGGELVGVG
jgi:hypothetical protein